MDMVINIIVKQSNQMMIHDRYGYIYGYMNEVMELPAHNEHDGEPAMDVWPASQSIQFEPFKPYLPTHVVFIS